MRISKRDQRLLLVLLGLAIFLFTYLTVCRAYDAKREELQSQIDSLAPRLAELRQYSSNLSSYQEEISKIEDSVDSELSKFPSDVRNEDMVMYADELQKNIGIKLNGISVAKPELMSRFDIPRESADGYKLVPVAAMRIGADIDCSMNYSQLKSLINYIYSTKEKTALKSVNISFNAETGGLTGTISVEKYFVSSADYSYQKTNIPSVETGVSDPFGTFSVSASGENAPAEKNEGN